MQSCNALRVTCSAQLHTWTCTRLVSLSASRRFAGSFPSRSFPASSTAAVMSFLSRSCPCHSCPSCANEASSTSATNATTLTASSSTVLFRILIRHSLTFGVLSPAFNSFNSFNSLPSSSCDANRSVELWLICLSFCRCFCSYFVNSACSEMLSFPPRSFRLCSTSRFAFSIL